MMANGTFWPVSTSDVLDTVCTLIDAAVEFSVPVRAAPLDP